MKQAHIRGYMIPNDLKWIYDWFEYDSTCPNDIQKVIDTLEPGEELQVNVNSGGGAVSTGQEIFSMLSRLENTTAIVDSEACSAASVAIMGAKKVIMSPVGMIMIHNASVGGWGITGDKNDFEKVMNELTETDKAIAAAYVHKTGRSEREILNLMNKETWLTANKAIELGFADEVMHDTSQLQAINAYEALPVTPEMIERAKAERANKEKEAQKQEILGDLYSYGI